MKREAVLLGIIALFILGLMLFSEETFALGNPPVIIEDYNNTNLTIPELNNTNITTPGLNDTPLPPPDLNETNITIPDLNETNVTIPGLNETNITIPDFNETDVNITIPDMNETNITIPDLNETNITLPEFNDTNITLPDLNETNTTLPEFNETNVSITSDLITTENVTVTQKIYIFANNILVASKTNNEPEKTQYYIQDHLGSNKLVLNGQTIDEENSYSEFGETDTQGNFSNSYKYTGKELDKGTGLYYYGARYYKPKLGRFIQADSLTGSIENPLSMNRYTYTTNNPINYIDPTGNEGQSAKTTVKSQPPVADSAKQTATYESDKKFTDKIHRATYYLYNKDMADSLNNIGFGRRDFAKDFPAEEKKGLNAIYNSKVDSIYVDTSNVAANQELSLLAGHEYGHVVTDLSVTKERQAQIWNIVDSNAVAGDKIATRLKTYVLSSYKGKPADMGNEVISIINNIILSGRGNSLPQWARDLSNMEKAKQDTKEAKANIDSAKAEFNKK